MKKITSRILPLYIPILFATCVAILIANAVSLFENLQPLKIINAQMVRTSHAIDKLQYLNVLIMDAESSTRGYFISDNKVYLGPFKTAKEEIDKEFAALNDLLQENPQQLKNLAQLHALFRKKMLILEQSISTYENHGLAEILKLAKNSEGREAMDEIRLLIVIMVREENDSQLARGTHYYDEYKNAVLLGTIINALAILVLVLFYRLNRRNFFNRLTVEAALTNVNENLEATIARRTAQLSTLSRHLINMSEEGKAKLARELHDELGSSLTAINMDVAWVTEKLKGIDQNLAARLQRARDMLLETVNLKRRIIENLRPSLLDSLGLAASIRSHCEDFSRISGIRCDVNMAEDFDHLDSSVMIALFRITQESLTNVIKYASAKTVTVSLKREDSDLVLQVADDGIGIDLDALNKPMSHGLLGMRERTLLLGGTFSIRHGANNLGTIVEARIPSTR